MQLSDYLILAGIALLLVAAVRASVKRRKKGGCGWAAAGAPAPAAAAAETKIKNN